ncbi:putative ribonuclease H-like domain-containing protein [Tanacetum coccineum]|uniref:Ribonuclease H-like domain-containing protein n=1 Tax=Tanacetum coccineum TaxID=301880 RepID=A0ABQ4WJR2_9ASTR
MISYTSPHLTPQPEQKVTCLRPKASLENPPMATEGWLMCDNGTEFKNAKLIELCGEKGIKRDYSNPRTPQQNGVAERKNRTLIEAARTMLADSKLPTMFWTEAVSTAFMQRACSLQRQEYEAKDAAARYGYLFSQATAEILCQAEAEIRNQGVSAVTDPAGIDSAVREPAGIVSADGVSTGSPSGC